MQEKNNKDFKYEEQLCLVEEVLSIFESQDYNLNKNAKTEQVMTLINKVQDWNFMSICFLKICN